MKEDIYQQIATYLSKDPENEITINDYLVDDLSEDERFYLHFGVDLVGTLRANERAVGLARSLGFVFDASHIAVRLRGSPGELAASHAKLAESP